MSRSSSSDDHRDGTGTGRPAGDEPALRELVRAVLTAVDPERLVRDTLSRTGGAGEASPFDAVVALGKAAAGMVRGAAAELGEPWSDLEPRRVTAPPPWPRGLVLRPASSPSLTPAGAGAAGPWEEWPGAHPVPDIDSMGGGRRLAAQLAALGPHDRLLALVSGGGSACCEVPAGRLAASDLADAGRTLLASGLPIRRLNAVRKHLSLVKGGGALRATEARVRVLYLSDVPGDDPSTVASGPFAADPSSYEEALAAVERLEMPPAVIRHLERGVAGELEETLKPGDPNLERVEHHLLAGNGTAVAAARRWLEERGFAVVTGELAGSAADAGRELVARGRGVEGERVAVVLGGETTVQLDVRTLRETATGHREEREGPAGSGGRNQELALAAAGELARDAGGDGRRERVLALATDGVDGPTPAAGAVVDRESWQALGELGTDPEEALALHRSHTALALLPDALLTPGPTGRPLADIAFYIRH